MVFFNAQEFLILIAYFIKVYSFMVCGFYASLGNMYHLKVVKMSLCFILTALSF